MLPILPHCTRDTALAAPLAITPRVTEAPTMPPTMEWVVDTGQPFLVAIRIQPPAASRAAIMM